MLIIGLTGGIGAGKTTAAQYFAELGAPIIDADDLAKTLTAVDTPAYHQIIAHFGTTIRRHDQTLDRQKLRDIIFTHAEQRQWLTALLHPLIRESIKQQLNILDAPYCIVVIPLLLEHRNDYPFIHRILLIDADEEQQCARASKRDQRTASNIAGIMATQLPRDQRQAQDIITNNSSLATLKQQVMALHEQYLALTSPAHPR